MRWKKRRCGGKKKLRFLQLRSGAGLRGPNRRVTAIGSGMAGQLISEPFWNALCDPSVKMRANWCNRLGCARTFGEAR